MRSNDSEFERDDVMVSTRKLSFAADYLEGAHPRVLQRLLETNMDHDTPSGVA